MATLLGIISLQTLEDMCMCARVSIFFLEKVCSSEFVLCAEPCDIRCSGLPGSFLVILRLGWVTLRSEGVGAHGRLGCLHSSLDDLERIRCLRVPVLIWMKLNRQFTIKLDELLGLHLSHACNEHIWGSIQEFVDEESLIFAYFQVVLRILAIRRRISHVLSSYKFVC